ncbi:unnamed protein product [Eruca vesicaria subsp. sativa]|uniref:Pectinesterase inhibitor domain-containing protein n=1 Tax=Eruca vesicaria subsp. sativa TaxID=29727 RepID=A0ABC8KKD2_ERUVS|nr:unnamed protein product [Eruca vesicaria subsp. sativa]
MAMSCIRRNSSSILQLIIVIIIITPLSSSFSPTDIVTKDLLDKLCSQTTRHRFCVRWLTADTTTTSMNIHGLMELTVEKTRALGLNNLALMNDFARGAGNDKQLKSAYESCAESYGIAIKELEGAKEFLRNSSFQQAIWAASKALTYALACKDQFEGPSNEPPLVLNRSEKFITMCHIASGFTMLFH